MKWYWIHFCAHTSVAVLFEGDLFDRMMIGANSESFLTISIQANTIAPEVDEKLTLRTSVVTQDFCPRCLSLHFGS
jgi:hypothetical protein